jgi:exodeoxyribonuclease V gamma subunit
MDPRDNSRREPSAVVTELLDAAADCHAPQDVAGRQAVREALVVRHALQPFAPAAYGAAHVGEGEGDPRRFSFDPRWRDAAQGTSLLQAEPVFAAPGFALARPGEDDDVVMLDRLRSSLLRPQATWLRDGLGLRLPEDEPSLEGHEPMGAPDALAHHGLREDVFAAWLRDGGRPDPARLAAEMLARARLAPGADGRAAVEGLLEEVGGFAQQALAHGFGGPARRVPVHEPIGARSLRGVLAGVYGVDDPRLLRVALRAKGRHGNLVLRHGLDWLVACVRELPVFELYRDDDESAPLLRPRPLVPPEQARAALASLVALHERIQREPLPFLPKSGHAFHAAPTPDRGQRAAQAQWCGDGFNATSERSAATGLALRGRDPFIDEDPGTLARFKWLAEKIFRAVENAEPFVLEDLQ